MPLLPSYWGLFPWGQGGWGGILIPELETNTMSVLQLQITSGRPPDYMQQTFETPGGNHSIAQRILNFISSLQTGSEEAAAPGFPPSIAIVLVDNEVRASGTFTLASVGAGNNITINGVTFTAVTGAPTGNQFQVGGTDNITALNLAASINASSTYLISGYVSAAVLTTNVVTVVSAFPGLAGNQTTISSGSGTITASGTNLAQGAPDPNALTLDF